jgi:KDO2-lipid IV(A) lauroyltransferase
VDNVQKAMRYGGLKSELPPAAIVDQSFIALGKNAVDMIKVYRGRGREVFDRVEVTGIEHWRAAMAQNRGVVVITGHCGAWDLMSASVSRLYGRSAAVARPPRNPYINHILEKMRTVTGLEVIYKEGALRGIMAALKQGKAVGVLIDQAVLRDEACVVEFLGRPALTTKSAALIARKTGAPVLPIFIHRNPDDSHTVVIEPPAALVNEADKEKAVRIDTQRFTDYVADYVRRRPTQWLWGHRRWKRAPAVMPGLNENGSGETAATSGRPAGPGVDPVRTGLS